MQYLNSNQVTIPYQITMPPSGDGSPLGLNIVGGSGVGSGIMASFKKNRSGGDPFSRFLVYNAGGFLYADAGAVATTHAVATQLGSSGQYESRMWGVVSGTVKLNGASSDPDVASHRPEFVPHSITPTMWSVYSDVAVSYGSRLPDQTPANPKEKMHHQMVGPLGVSALEIEQDCDLAYMDGVVPTATWGVDRAAHVDFRMGRWGKKGWGGKNGGVLGISSFVLSDITNTEVADAVDLYVAPSAGSPGFSGQIEVMDAPTPGVYIASASGQWELISNRATKIGPDSYNFTGTTYLYGPTAPVITATANSTYEKTAGVSSWDSARHTTAATAGNQLIEARLTELTASSGLGFFENAVGTTTGDDIYAAAQSKMTGVLKTANVLFAVDRGVVNFGTPLAITLAATDKLTLRRVGTSVSLYVNGIFATAISTTLPVGAVRAGAIFNNVGAKLSYLRWRTI